MVAYMPTIKKRTKRLDRRIVLMNHKKRTKSRNEEASTLSAVSDSAESAMASAQDTLKSNKGLFTAVGVGAAIATYLLGTEHGRKTQARIGQTAKDSFCKVRDAAVSGWGQLRTVVQERVNGSSGNELMSEDKEFQSEMQRLDDIRRIV
jgi:hypothetical protein